MKNTIHTVLPALLGLTLSSQAAVMSTGNMDADDGGSYTAGVYTRIVTLAAADIDASGGANDILRFTLTGKAGGTSTGIQSGGGPTWGATGGDNNRVNAGESLTFSIGTVEIDFDSAGSFTSSGFTVDLIQWTTLGVNSTTTDGDGTISGSNSGSLDVSPTGNHDYAIGTNNITGELTFASTDLSTRIIKVAADITVTPIPEPSSTALLGLGGLALILRRRK